MLKRKTMTTAIAGAITGVASFTLTLPASAQQAATPNNAASAEKKEQPKASAGADTASANPGALQEIVVTARRVGERLQDVPLSIRALGAAELESKGIANISELSTYTPGLSYSPDFGRTAERPVIRGISALRPEAPQPVSVFVNGVFVRDGALGLLLDDAARVEVIKGPQSALYGRSTYAGAINYITTRPGNELEGKVTATAGSNGEQSLFAAVTIPAGDRFSARIRAKSYDYDGQYTNSQTGNKIGNERTRSAGGEFLFKISPSFDVLAAFDQAKDRDGLFNATVRTIPIQAAGVITSQNGTTNVPNLSTCNGRTINIVGNNAAGLPDANVPGSLTNRLNGWPCGASTFTGTTVRRNELDLANYTDPATGVGYGNIAGLDRKVTRSSLTATYTFGSGATLTAQAAQTKQDANVGADQSYNGTRFAPGFGAPASSWLSYDRDTLKYSSEEVRFVSAQDTACHQV